MLIFLFSIVRHVISVSSVKSQVSKIALWGCSLNVMVIVIVYFDQVMSHHHSGQMSHWSQVSEVWQFGVFDHLDNCKDNPGDLWHLRHWLKFLPLRTWIHDNPCYLAIKSDTWPHFQFLQYFLHRHNFGFKKRVNGDKADFATKRNMLISPQVSLT